MHNVVLLHGFWHGTWCWTPITTRLAARGIPSLAVELEGHGLSAVSPQCRWSVPFDAAAYATEPSPVAGVTASSAADTLLSQLNGPSVVVAHSMAGPVATLAAERAPELFAHLLYVAAFTPVSGLPAAAYIGAPENAGDMVGPLLTADPATIGALRLPVSDRARHPELHKAFYDDVDQTVADAAIALLSPDAPAGIAGEAFTVTRERYGTVPKSYVFCGRDNAVRPDLQRRLIREIDAVSAQPTRVHELDSSHSPFLSNPDALTAIVEGCDVR
ncbi:alpha/beta fold hydrolase [Cryptosporangium sp. NPDC048952]|uniref:alpha/beta fold hydrolase n=1 Tax=Cryptosporangium sp. NPDC048952 TaxID=3363961 RepID=UPI0037167C4F